VRVISIALVLLVVGFGSAAVRPAAVSACSGVALDLEDALRLSDGAVYAGRISRAEMADTFWVDLTIDIDRVVRGPADSRVRRVQAGHVCDGIQVGQYGYIVRGIENPDYGPGQQDMFFRVSRSEARTALLAAGLPDTSTPSPGETPTAHTSLWTWLAVLLAATVVLTFLGLCRHRRDGLRP
jgi:hypothetical protein